MRSNPTYWDKVRKELRPKFDKVGLLNICELYNTKSEYRSPKCTKDKYLTFAHSLRRKAIDRFKKDGDDEMYEFKMRNVARLCSSCHAIVDGRKPLESEAIIEEIIGNRTKQP